MSKALKKVSQEITMHQAMGFEQGENIGRVRKKFSKTFSKDGKDGKDDATALQPMRHSSELRW